MNIHTRFCIESIELRDIYN